jgi:hypothetical protein
MSTATRTLTEQDLAALELAQGSHSPDDGGMCFMEAAAYFAGEPFTDHPQCVCPTLGLIGRAWNDYLPDAERQSLKQYIPLLIGTNGGSALADTRAWAYVNWTLRTMLPIWMHTEPALALALARALALDLDANAEIQASKHALFKKLISMQAAA